MRILDPILNDAFTALGASEEEKKMLVDYVVAQAANVRGQVNSLRANAEQAFNAANDLEPQAVNLETMLEKFTNEVPDPEVPINPAMV